MLDRAVSFCREPRHQLVKTRVLRMDFLLEETGAVAQVGKNVTHERCPLLPAPMPPAGPQRTVSVQSCQPKKAAGGSSRTQFSFSRLCTVASLASRGKVNLWPGHSGSSHCQEGRRPISKGAYKDVLRDAPLTGAPQHDGVGTLAENTFRFVALKFVDGRDCARP